MFLLEAIPTIVLGFVVLRALPDRHTDVSWLTPDEKNWLTHELASESPAHGAHTQSLRQALLLPRVWRYGLVYFCVLVGLYGFSFWLPQIIASLGKLTYLQVGAVTAIPYSLACIALVLWGRHSDATGERSWHVALPPLLAALALAAGGWLTEPVVAFGGLCLAAIGIYAGLPAFWALASRGLQGAAAAGAIALINSLGNIGGFLGPAAIGFVKERTGSFAISMLFIASCLVVGAVVVMWERARDRRALGLVSKVSP
jgi:ACS family tartrate transporter-like MFS transporter